MVNNEENWKKKKGREESKSAVYEIMGRREAMDMGIRVRMG